MTNNKQQTAVEWLESRITTLIPNDIGSQLMYKNNIKKAKEMENEQIIDSWRDGFINGRKSVINEDFSNAIQYYNETYGGNK